MSFFSQNPLLQKANNAFSANCDFSLHDSHPTNLDRTEQNSKDVRFQATNSPLVNSQFQPQLNQCLPFSLDNTEESLQDCDCTSTQPTMVPEPSMLRERTFSSISWRQARKIGYPWESPSLRIPNHSSPNLILRPQKSDENPPPIRLPSPVKNRLQPPPRLSDEDGFSLDDLSWNYGQTLQPKSAPYQLNYKDSPLKIPSQSQEQIYFFDSQESEDEQAHHSQSDCQDFTPSLGGMLHHSYSSTNSSSPSPNSILGFMERRLHQANSESCDDTDCA